MDRSGRAAAVAVWCAALLLACAALVAPVDATIRSCAAAVAVVASLLPIGARFVARPARRASHDGRDTVRRRGSAPSDHGTVATRPVWRPGSAPSDDRTVVTRSAWWTSRDPPGESVRWTLDLGRRIGRPVLGTVEGAVREPDVMDEASTLLTADARNGIAVVGTGIVAEAVFDALAGALGRRAGDPDDPVELRTAEVDTEDGPVRIAFAAARATRPCAGVVLVPRAGRLPLRARTLVVVDDTGCSVRQRSDGPTAPTTIVPVLPGPRERR